jgi:hypothetical protein
LVEISTSKFVGPARQEKRGERLGEKEMIGGEERS